MDLAQPAQRRVYSVSGLNREVRFHLEGGFGSVWVEGEVSNLYRARSGHCYFSLKDAAAQLKCALFRQRDPYGRIQLADGQQILVRGRISLYEPRGEYQLIADHVEDAGEGRLRREFDRLKQQLAAEGLFARERKRPLPAHPRTIAVVTSPDGAAIRDVISVVARRYPVVRLVVVPSRVQGDGAAAELLRAFARAEALAPDAILLTRGGGSLEDLQAFNDEALARAIAASAIPTVCAVGHESDASIAEFAADVRGATPSAAAELMVPDGRALRERVSRARRILERRDPRRDGERRSQRVDELTRRLARCLQQELTRRRAAARAFDARLRALHPRLRLDSAQAQCERLERALARCAGAQLTTSARRVREARARLHRSAPDRTMLVTHGNTLRGLQQRLGHAVEASLRETTLRSGGALSRLRALSPQAVLDRGYSITRSETTGAVLRAAGEAATGERLVTRLARGELVSRVEPED